MKKISKLGVCLIGALAISSFAQDYAGQDLNTSFRDKRIDGFNFSDAKAKKGVTDFQRSAGEQPNFKGAQLPEVSFRNAVINEANFKDANLKKVTIKNTTKLKLYQEAGYNFRYVYFSEKKKGTQLFEATFRESDYQ